MWIESGKILVKIQKKCLWKKPKIVDGKSGNISVKKPENIGGKTGRNVGRKIGKMSMENPKKFR